MEKPLLVKKLSIRENGIHIETDDGMELLLPAGDERAGHLRQGDELSTESYHALRALSQDHQAYRSALSLLARRDRSVRETARYLERKGFHGESVDYAIKRLLDKGYLDDERYGLKLAESLAGKKVAGADLIKRKLIQKGITGEVLKSVMASAETEQPYEKILSMARKKYLSLEGKKNPRDKLVVFLRSRGFGAEIIRRVLKDLDQDDELYLEN